MDFTLLEKKKLKAAIAPAAVHHMLCVGVGPPGGHGLGQFECSHGLLPRLASVLLSPSPVSLSPSSMGQAGICGLVLSRFQMKE